MTLAIDSQESGGVAHNSAASPLTWSFNNVAGNLLLVSAIATGGGGATTVTGVTYNTVAMTQVTNGHLSYDNDTDVYLFFLLNPATGSKTVSVAATGAFSDILGSAVSLSGANTSAPTGTAVTATAGGGNVATASIAGTTSGSIVLSVVATGSGVTSTFGPGTTTASLNAGAGTSGDNISSATQPTPGGTVIVGYSITSDQWGVVAVEVFAAPAPGVPGLWFKA